MLYPPDCQGVVSVLDRSPPSLPIASIQIKQTFISTNLTSLMVFERWTAGLHFQLHCDLGDLLWSRTWTPSSESQEWMKWRIEEINILSEEGEDVPKPGQGGWGDTMLICYKLQTFDIWTLRIQGKQLRHFRMVGEGTCLSPTPCALHSLHPLLPAKIILNTVNPSASPNQSPAQCCLTAQPFHWHCSQPCHCQPPKERNRRNRVFILQTTTLPGWLCSKVSLPVLLSPSVCLN